MGHTRLGTLPKSRSWRAVAAMLASDGTGDGVGLGGGESTAGSTQKTDFGYEVSRIAELAMEGAAAAFEKGQGDPGIADAFFLLTKVATACRTDKPAETLWELGLQLPAEPSGADVLGAVNQAIDDAAFAFGSRSDLSEMGQAAMSEALAGWLRSRNDQGSLFGLPKNKLWSDLRGLATQDGFAEVSHRMFAGLAARLLGFYLSRAVRPLQDEGVLVGNIGDMRRFEEELRRHSLERARIARDFAGTWFTKQEFQRGGIDRAKARRFVGYAMKKMATELRGGPNRA